MGTARDAVTDWGKGGILSHCTAAPWVSWLVEGLLRASVCLTVLGPFAYILSTSLCSPGAGSRMSFLFKTEKETEVLQLRWPTQSAQLPGSWQSRQEEPGPTVSPLCFFSSSKTRMKGVCMFISFQSEHTNYTCFSCLVLFCIERIWTKLQITRYWRRIMWNLREELPPTPQGRHCVPSSWKLRGWRLQLDHTSGEGQALTLKANTVCKLMYVHTCLCVCMRVWLHMKHNTRRSSCVFCLLTSELLETSFLGRQGS